MKLTKLLGLTTLLLGIAAADAQQTIVPVTISVQIISQSTNTTDIRGVTTTPPPRRRFLSNRDILNRVAADTGTTFGRGARLALVNGDFAVVQGTNVVADISQVVRFTTGGTTIMSGRQSDTNGLASPTITRITVAGITFDDTSINTTNALRFSMQGLATIITSDTRPNNTTGNYNQSDTLTIVNASGDGTNNIGSGVETPIIVTGSAFGSGSNRQTLP